MEGHRGSWAAVVGAGLGAAVEGWAGRGRAGALGMVEGRAVGVEGRVVVGWEVEGGWEAVG